MFILPMILSLIHKAQTFAVKFDWLISCVKDFPGDPVLKTPPPNAGLGEGSIPGWEAKNPHASRPKEQNIKQKQYCKIQ